MRWSDLIRHRALEQAERRGAIGKALLVWLFSGSLVVALIAYLIFAGIGC